VTTIATEDDLYWLAKFIRECVATGSCYVKVKGEEHTVLTFESQRDQDGQAHLALYTETRDDELDRVAAQPDSHNAKVYPHYFKPVPANQTHVDVYWVLEAWQTSNPIGHAVKKLLCAGGRGAKDRAKDLREAIDSVNRALELEGL
jgi:hypothetical protein